MASSEIHGARTVSGNQPNIIRQFEEAAQTFIPGTPLSIAADGGIQAWNGSTITNGIVGFSTEPASNLTTLGVPKTLTFGQVPYETSAVNIPRGAPLNDGRIGFEVANSDTIFYGQVGPSQTAVKADVGVAYGMTKDSDGHWYVDRTKTTTNAVVQIVKLSTVDTIRGVYFIVLPSSQQLQF